MVPLWSLIISLSFCRSLCHSLPTMSDETTTIQAMLKDCFFSFRTSSVYCSVIITRVNQVKPTGRAHHTWWQHTRVYNQVLTQPFSSHLGCYTWQVNRFSPTTTTPHPFSLSLSLSEIWCVVIQGSWSMCLGVSAMLTTWRPRSALSQLSLCSPPTDWLGISQLDLMQFPSHWLQAFSHTICLQM